MFVDDKQRVIGKVISIDSKRCYIELIQRSDNFIVNGFDDVHKFAQINSYVIIPNQNNYILAEVLGVREKEAFDNNKEKIKFEEKISGDTYLEVTFIGEIKKNNGKNKENKGEFIFEFGISNYPLLYTDVLYVKDQELDVIFNVQDDNIERLENGSALKVLSIGTSAVLPDYEVKINIKSFFSKHSAILGNTGSGKSCTIASILQSLFEKSDFSACGSTFIVFDTNGEYLQAFESLNNKDIKITYLSPEQKQLETLGVVTKKKFLLPHWYLNFDEWALLLQASEKVQLPVLRTTINLAKLLQLTDVKDMTANVNHIIATCIRQVFASTTAGAAGQGNAIFSMLNRLGKTEFIELFTKHRFNTQFGNFPNLQEFFDELNGFIINDFSIKNSSIHSYFNLEELENLLDLAILYEESFGHASVRNFCSTLIIRVRDLLSRDEFKFLRCDPELKYKDYVFDLLGLKNIDNNVQKESQVIIIDLSVYQDEVVEVIAAVISRMLIETLQQAQPRNKFPINIIVEEAHRYISELKSDNHFQAKKIFERIAKEGRKYGVSLLVSSQRPSELSKTVLSQCSNFIVHRIMNPDDLTYIRKMTPYVSEEILDQLPFLPRQHALMFGDAINIPLILKVRSAAPKPFSDDNQIIEHWFVKKESEINIKFPILEVQSTEISAAKPAIEVGNLLEINQSLNHIDMAVPMSQEDKEMNVEDIPF